MRRYSSEFYQRLAREQNADVGFRQHGGLAIATNEAR